ncbi:MAG TPA: hypothetical protein VJV21_02485 [Pyrinomonadaceae bacterium]|nr:hypothetical protein [Pyrinomonadaceae bacterium]
MIEIYAGQSLLLYKPKPGQKDHCFVVLTEPCGEPAKVVIANFTSVTPTSDPTLVLDVGDHPYLKKLSAVNYGDAVVTEVGNLQALLAINKQFLLKNCDCPKTTLDKMRKGVLRSDRTPEGVKEYWRETQGQ